ncbi:MAG: 1-acyl-sn-glycerol-3-phosphate acyltransferase [Candidatus Omnitrophica bacterium]|nr:1-acyl-sn-glycerol-3-phosphate acyltransferase [Candidatus Omnitrophota bacterium]
MKKILLSIIIWAVGSLLTIILYFVMLLFAVILYPFDKKRAVVHKQCFWWSDAVIALNPYWKVEVSGINNIEKSRTYIIVANHQSMADIVLAYQIKMQFKWVAKKSLFKLPFLGWSMSLAKHIKLERGNFGSIKKVYREAAYWLRNGISVLFFPEGTRSNTNQMGDFRNGAFKLAIKERVPILPIAFEGTGTAIPRGSWIFTTKTSAKLKIMPAIETTDYNLSDFARLRDLTRSVLEKNSGGGTADLS